MNINKIEQGCETIFFCSVSCCTGIVSQIKNNVLVLKLISVWRVSTNGPFSIIRRRANHPWDQRYHCATW